MKHRIALIRSVAIGASMVALATVALGNDPGFTASLQDCTELIGLGPVPLSAVQGLVPSGYAIAPFGNGVAGLVVRASECRALSIDHSPARTVRIAQIGVSIASPDGTGDINNYTLMYATNDARLAAELLETGLVIGFDPLFAYEYNNVTGEVYVAVSPVVMPSWFETGTASNPPAGGTPVSANWWAHTRRGTVKMTTSIPAISYGSSGATVLHTSKVSPLGAIIGGNTDSSFPFFNARGAFASGTFTVGVR